MTDDEKDTRVTSVNTSDHTSDEIDTSNEIDTERVGGQPSPLRHVALGLSVVALVFAVLVGWLAYGAMQDSAAETARTEARVAAEEQAVAMLAYTYGEVDEQIAVAAEGLTGDFRDEYTNLMKNIIAPGAKEKAISVQVSVQASSVVSTDADSAVTLLFLNQITTSSENPEAVSSGSRVRVELEKQDGRWLVSRLTPV